MTISRYYIRAHYFAFFILHYLLLHLTVRLCLGNDDDERGLT